MNVKEYINQNILLFDGAMGSYFAGIHSDPQYPPEYANLTSPHTIAEIHKRYLLAGAKAIKTNTFSLPYEKDTPFSAEDIIVSAYKIAKNQAEPFGAYVFADLTTALIPDTEDLLPYYKNLVDIFLSQGATNFLFETCHSIAYLNELAKHIKENCPESYIITSFALGRDGVSKDGETGTSIVEHLSEDVDAIGLNCIIGPHHMSQLFKKIPSNKLLSAMPNASYPTVLGSRVSYSQNPVYFAEEITETLDQGIKIVGGCCGTTPEFIAQIHSKLKQTKPKEKVIQPSITLEKKVIRENSFYEKLTTGKKPIAVEWDTPSRPDITAYFAKAQQLKEAGIDLMTIADCPVAQPRLDSSLMACKLKRELKLDVMPHMTCRDRNINAVKALLLGLSVEEINNLLIITGDPVPQELRQDIKTVYEFNSRKFIKNIHALNQTLFHSPFYLYGALNINALNFQMQLKLAQEKIDNGAVGLFTQPVMSERGYENLKIAKETLTAPLMAGIFPPTSYRNICFLKNEISGFHVAPELEELYRDKTPEECSKLAVHVSKTIAKEIAPYTDGFYLITPFQRVDISLEIIKYLKTLQ